MDGEAASVLGFASLVVGEIHPIGLVCRRVLGVIPAFATQAEESRLTDEKIFIRCGEAPARVRYITARELARWWLRRRYGIEPTEDACRRLAGALLCPREPFAVDATDCGGSVRELARRYSVPEALVLLRLGEVTGRAAALVDNSSNVVYLRGRAHGQLRRVVLHDGDQRYGLMSRGGSAV